MSVECAEYLTMNVFDEDQYANKMHFSNNFDCDSDSDKSDFDERYYNNRPPPVCINYNCNVVKIEPFTTVSYTTSISKIIHRANARFTQNGSVVSASVHDNSVQSAKKTKKKKVRKPIVASASTVNKLKLSSATPKTKENFQPTLQQMKNFDGPKLMELMDYQENNAAHRPKEKLDQTKNAKPFSLSPIEWPALDRHSSTKNGVQSWPKTVKIVSDPKVRQKGLNTSSQIIQPKYKKNKLKFEAVFQSDVSESLRINAENLQNSLSLKNNKLLSKAKTKALQSSKENSPPFGNWEKLVTSQRAVSNATFITPPGEINNNPTATNILDNMHSMKPTQKQKSETKKESSPKQLDNNSQAFNLSSLKWPSLNKSINENNTQKKKSARNRHTKTEKNQKLKRETTWTKVGDYELEKGFWSLNIAESGYKSNTTDCNILKNTRNNKMPKITQPQQKITLSKLNPVCEEKQCTGRKLTNVEPHQGAVESIQCKKKHLKKMDQSVNTLTTPHDERLNDTVFQEISDNTEHSAVEVQYSEDRRREKVGVSDISVNQHIALSETKNISTDIVDINREMKVNCWRPEQIISILRNRVSKLIDPCSSYNDWKAHKNKTKNHNITPTQKTVESNKCRADKDLLLLEDFLPTFNEIPNTIDSNSIIPLNSLVTGGRDLFSLDKILFSQSSFSIHAKPRLAMSNMFLHFCTGYRNDMEFLM